MVMNFLRIISGVSLIVVGLYLMIVFIKTSWDEYGKGGDSLGKALNLQGIWGAAILIFAGILLLSS